MRHPLEGYAMASEGQILLRVSIQRKACPDEIQLRVAQEIGRSLKASSELPITGYCIDRLSWHDKSGVDRS
jgi:hypothetical protein